LADPIITETIAFFNHPETSYAVRAERALLKRCEGGCQVPIAAHGTVANGQLRLVGFIAAVDGSRSVRGEISGPMDECEKLGIQLADQLLAEGGKAILEEVYQREINA
jgi:hydroxymethylbilane synthase